ncbi:MAG: thioredoxin family protein [bacterium]
MRSPMLVAALTFAAFTFGPAFAQQVIVESSPQGQNYSGYSEVLGKWNDSIGKSALPQLTLGVMTRFADIYDGIPSTARFTPDLPKDGNYEVAVVWPASGNAFNVKYVIHHAGSEDVAYLDQDGWGGKGPTNANQWQPLGVYEFKKGSEGWVSVSDEEVKGTPNDENLGRIYADAVSFTLTDKPLSGPPPSPQPVSTPTASAPEPTPVSIATPEPQVTSVAPAVPSPTPEPRPLVEPTPGPIPPPPPSPSPPLLTFATPTPSVPVKAGINWYRDLAQAQQDARAQNKKIMVYFKSDRAQVCQQYSTKTFLDLNVVSLIQSRFVPVEIDVTDNSQIAIKLGVFRAGTIIFYDAAGQPLGKIEHFLPAEQFISELKKI